MTDSTSIVLSDATSEELDEAAKVMVRAYEEYAPQLPPGMWKEYRKDIQDVRGRLPDSELVVAKHDGTIVGAVTYYPRRNDPEGRPTDHSGVRLLAVAPSSRGKGIGRLLTEECIARSRENGAASLLLHNMEMMSVAAGLYERMGFVRVPDLDHHIRSDSIVKAYRLTLLTR